MSVHPPSRRSVLGRLAVPVATLAAPRLLMAAPLALQRPTPTQTEGPFYPVSLPQDTDFDLLRQAGSSYAGGEPAWLEGRVIDTSGRPLGGAVVEIWQCDAQGHYRHPDDGNRADPAFQSFGRVQVDRGGGYRFRTIRPVPYDGRTPHIHVKVRRDGRTLLTTQLYVEGDPGNARDSLWRSLSNPLDRAALTVPFRPGSDGLHAQFAIVVAG